MREIKEVLMELVDVQREFLLAQEEVRREMVYLQMQLAGAIVVMMEGIAYVQDPEQDARDYDQWVEETKGEIIQRELEDLAKEKAAAAEGAARAAAAVAATV